MSSINYVTSNDGCNTVHILLLLHVHPEPFIDILSPISKANYRSRIFGIGLTMHFVTLRGNRCTTLILMRDWLDNQFNYSYSSNRCSCTGSSNYDNKFVTSVYSLKKHQFNYNGRTIKLDILCVRHIIVLFMK